MQADAAGDWVSRAALKLVHGLDHFHLDPIGRTALDIGASTGGFTQVLLARGASHVHAVDVGRGQLVPALRVDPRVTVLERQNARTLTAAHLPTAPDFITCDASFIGLATILPTPLSLTAADACLVALIKPQFEVGPGKVDRGIVRDPALHREVCDRIVGWLGDRMGWQVLGVTPSPILGGDGNREFLVAAVRR